MLGFAAQFVWLHSRSLDLQILITPNVSKSNTEQVFCICNGVGVCVGGGGVKVLI